MQKAYCLIFLTMLGYTLQGQNTISQAEDNALFRKGLELLDKSNYTAARETFENYIERSHNDSRKSDAAYYLAFSALNLYHNDGEKLVEEFIRQHENHPKAIVAYYELGNLHFKRKNYKNAVKYLSKVKLSAVTADQREEIRFKLGYAHFSQRNFEGALTYFNVLKRQQSPYSAASSYYAGYIAYETGAFSNAISDLKRAEAHESYKAVVPGMIAGSYYKQKRYNELIDYSEKLLRGTEAVKQKDFYLFTADAYLNTGDFKNAADFYDSYGAKIRNPSRDIRYRTGYVNYRLGNDKEAIDQLKYAASNEDSIGIYASYYLGILYLKEGNKIYARTAFDNIRKNEIIISLKEEGLYQYGKVNYDLGRSEDAIASFIEFTEKYPTSEHINEVNDLLSEAYLNSDNYNLAIRHIEKLRSMNRKMEEVYQKATFLKGAELFNRGMYREAIAFFKKSLQHPIDTEYKSLANLWAAEAYSIGRRYEEAIPYYLAILGNSYNNTPSQVLSARYGIGYAYYNTEAYSKALIHFKAYVNELERANDKAFYDDALLRLADCYYISKSYNDALTYYRRAISSNKADNDYAHLQAGIVLGIQGNVEGAKSAYDHIIKNYSSSRYYDDAIFQKAQLSFERGNYEEATTGFTKLVSVKASSPFVPYAYMRRASCYYNMKQYDKAIEDYKKILGDFPTHPAAEEVLLPLQDVLNMQERSDEFDTYLAKYKRANPDKKGVEHVEFETAKNQYFNLNYKKTIAAFKNYIQDYPDNPKVQEAKFYIAESYYRQKQFEEALNVYNEILSEGTFHQLSRVIHRIADIEFSSKRTKNANFFYYRLEKAANTKKEQYYAWAGLMESYYLMGEYDSTAHYANVILERGNVNISSQNKASLYLGKAAYAKGDFETAKDEFLSTLNTAKDAHGAEAQYMLGQIFYQKGEYQRSIEALIEVNNSFNPYQEWVGKAYLLMADNYIALDDLFQAKGTLNSIIENFPDEEIKEKAKVKLAEIEAMQKELEDRRESESDSLTIDMESIDNKINK